MSWGRRRDTNRPYPKGKRPNFTSPTPQAPTYQRFDSSTVAGARDTIALADSRWPTLGARQQKKLMQAINSERNKIGFSHGKDSEQYCILTAWINAHKKAESEAGNRRDPRGLPAILSVENQNRVEAAKDLGMMAAERNPVIRTIKDSYDTADALERLRTGEKKSLINKVRDR